MANQRLKEELQKNQSLTNELQRAAAEKQYAVSQMESNHNAVQSRLHVRYHHYFFYLKIHHTVKMYTVINTVKMWDIIIIFFIFFI